MLSRATGRDLLGLSQQLLSQSVSPFWVALSLTAAPFYVMVLSPMVALLIRQVLSHERDLLADADAVRLTLDPEGLVLGLAKVNAAQTTPRPDRSRGTAGEGCVHLYFVDPLEGEPSLLHDIFPSHPRLMERIQLLARMGNVEPSELEAAWTAVRKTRQAQPERVDVDLGTEGNFVRIITKDNVSGYVATRAVHLEPFERSGIS